MFIKRYIKEFKNTLYNFKRSKKVFKFLNFYWEREEVGKISLVSNL